MLAVRQALLEEPEEEPLRPAVEGRIVRGDDAVISRGFPPSLIAAFSAGSPNESQPIGRSTRSP
jgi:hypothetical protein